MTRSTNSLWLWTPEEHLLLVVVHGHVTTGHLDHAVVDRLIGVLQGFKVHVFQSEARSGGLVSLIAGAHVEEEACNLLIMAPIGGPLTHVHGAGEDLALS